MRKGVREEEGGGGDEVNSSILRFSLIFICMQLT